MQLTDRSEIHGNCRARNLLEEVLPQDDVQLPRWLSWEESSQRLQPRRTIRSHESRAGGCRVETHRGLPLEVHAQKATKLILEPPRRASRPRDCRQPQLAS